MKSIKKILSLSGTFFCAIVLIVFCIAHLFPNFADQYFPYRMYTILTNSMEPVLPVDSLVIVKNLNGREPQPEEIITFQADRFGETITLTHYFGKCVVVDDVTYYRTHANGIDTFDLYETTYQDIKGSYVTHIPYIGRFVLYLGSPFGLVMLLITLFITLLYHTLNERFDLDEEVHLPHRKYNRKHKEDESLTIHNVQIYDEDGYIIIKGEIWNETMIQVHHVKGKIVFYNHNGEKVASQIFYMIGSRPLPVHHCEDWYLCMKAKPNMEHIHIDILRAKKSIRG